MSELEPLDSLEPASEASEPSVVIFEPDHDDIRENFENENERKAKSEIERGIEAYCGAGRLDDAVALLKLQSEYEPNPAAVKLDYKKKLLKIFETDREGQILVNNSGFENPGRRIKVTHCLARYQTLKDLKPGTKCYDKTWGFGIVKSMILTENKVQVDFDNKPGHLMALNYAAESLQLVDDSHLFSRRHAEPEVIAEMIKKQPAEIVKLVLHSFGPKPVPIIQEILVPEFVEDKGWKRFWDAARKKLKNDGHIIFPAKRSEVMILLESELAYDDDWFAQLAKNTDMKSILDKVSEFLEKEGKDKLTEENKIIVASRLAFVAKGAEGKHHDLVVQSLLLALEYGITIEEVGLGEFIDSQFNAESFQKVLADQPARNIRPLLVYLLGLKREEAIALFLEVLNDVEYSAFSEIVALLRKEKLEDAAANKIRSHWNQWTLNVAGIYWVNMNLDLVDQWKIGSPVEVAMRNLSEMQKDYMGEKLKVRNQIREFFNQPQWLQSVMDGMDIRQRKSLTQGVKDSTAWAKLDQASVLGKIVKLYPEMQQIVSERAGEQTREKSRGPVVSIRTYKKLEAQLRKLITEEIPQNSKEIGIAREYGDLRENFEFKAAKDQQRLLMQRQTGIEQTLGSVTPTNFEGYPNDKAGIATKVSIRYEDGQLESFVILGTLDSDETLNIISCDSRLAEVLAGSVAGDRLVVPSEEGEKSCIVESVEGLPAEIVAWIESEVTSA